MTTIQINDNTKIGKTVLEMLKALACIENDNSIKIMDETEYLFSTKANKEALLHGISQIKEGKKGKTLKISEIWKSPGIYNFRTSHKSNFDALPL
jgi:hypothetical protein